MKFALLSSKAPMACVTRLEELGYFPLSLPPFERLSPPVNTHADMLLFSYANKIITHREYYECASDIFDILCRECGIGIILCDDDIQNSYPHDVAFNATVSKGTLFANLSHTSKTVLKLAKNMGLMCHDVAQGYTACSTLDLGDGHIVCADPSLISAYKSHGIDVTAISNGSVCLPPYDYGFIGGCSGVDRDTVYFCGDIRLHSDADLIKKAVERRSMKAVSLSDQPLFDIGGIKFFG